MIKMVDKKLEDLKEMSESELNSCLHSFLLNLLIFYLPFLSLNPFF
jgi:hypothetical protein